MAGDVSCELGVWRESAVRNVPRGPLSWQGMRGRVYTAAVGHTAPVATIRKAPYHPQWVVSIPGFEWDVRGERGSTTTRALGIETSPSRAFPSSKEAKRAVEQAYAALLARDIKNDDHEA